MYARISTYNERPVFTLQHHNVDLNGLSGSVTLQIGEGRDIALGMSWLELGELVDFLQEARSQYNTRAAQTLYPELW